ncbi:MAG TPA: TetR/AcrR family transcriptional regulator [Holophagaceae bacterium]|nr:TetR/AcrR family transcriptional regulator [Holophagaceae bacterium]
MSRPASTSRHPDTRQQLLKAAALCFAEKGFEGTSTRDIAERAGCALSSIAYHFSTKDLLYAETFRYLFDRYPKAPYPVELADPEAIGKDPVLAERALRAHITALFEDMEHGRRDPLRVARFKLYIAEMQDPRPSLHDLYRERLGRSVAHLKACIRGLRPDLTEAEVALLGQCIHGQCLIHFLAAGVNALVWNGGPGTATPAEMAARIADLALDGIRMRKETR